MIEFKEGRSVYCVLLKNDDGIYIQCGDDGRIMAFPTEGKTLDFWENGYKSAFSRGLCGTTGAMIGMIQCQPKVVYFEDEVELEEILFNKPPYKKFNIYGGIYGILCQRDVEQLWTNGIEPDLLERI